MGRQFNYIVRRGNTFSVRVMIPKSIRHHYNGRREKLRALGTSNPLEARIRGAELVAAIFKEFDYLRRHGSFPPVAESEVTVPKIVEVIHSNEGSDAFKLDMYSERLIQHLRPSNPKKMPTVMEAFEMYVADNPRGIAPDTFGQKRYAIGLYAQFLGENSPVSAITRESVRNWKFALSEWPLRANEISELKGLSFSEAIIVSRELWGPGVRPSISKKTANRYLSDLGGFCAWMLAATEYIKSNPVDGLYHKIDRTERPVHPFRIDQLRTIFSSPLYTGCESSEVDFRPGSYRVRDYRYWLPLIALYSGARLGEIAQMLTGDIKQLHEHWVFHITREGSVEKTTKTAGSQRVVPIHPVLIELGLLDYHLEQQLREETRMFPEIVKDRRGQISGYPSRWFGRYMKRMKLREGNRYNFHSFRHAATDALRLAGYGNDQIDPLLGHVSGSMTARYGLEPVGTIKQRAEMIEAITYDLDLSHLVPSSDDVIRTVAA